jgi:hypothetical protein
MYTTETLVFLGTVFDRAVIPAKAGIQEFLGYRLSTLDSRFRGNDNFRARKKPKSHYYN